MKIGVDLQTKSQTFQLYNATTISNFIVCLFIIKNFSVQLECITSNTIQFILS